MISVLLSMAAFAASFPLQTGVSRTLSLPSSHRLCQPARAQHPFAVSFTVSPRLPSAFTQRSRLSGVRNSTWPSTGGKCCILRAASLVFYFRLQQALHRRTARMLNAHHKISIKIMLMLGTHHTHGIRLFIRLRCHQRTKSAQSNTRAKSRSSLFQFNGFVIPPR